MAKPSTGLDSVLSGFDRVRACLNVMTKILTVELCQAELSRAAIAEAETVAKAAMELHDANRRRLHVIQAWGGGYDEFVYSSADALAWSRADRAEGQGVRS